MNGTGTASTCSGRWCARLAALVLLMFHGWLTLQLFGPPQQSTLLTPEPILAGEHALHLVHGELGAEAWRERGQFTSYDPRFQAGYPKTPWFDADSKPAELAWLLAGSLSGAAAYKVGLALTWALLPAVGYLAAALLGLSHGVRCLALALQILLAWSDLGTQRLWEGDWAWLLGCGLLVLTLALLTRMFSAPGLRTWLGSVVCLTLVIFFQPALLLLLLPAMLVFYLRVGWQRSWTWQASLATLLLGALLANGPWLLALGENWWLLAEPPSTGPASIVSAGWLDWWAEVLAGASYMSGLLVVAGLWGLHRLRRCLPTGGTRGWLVVMVEALGLAVLAPLLDGWFHGEAVRCFHLALFVATLPAAVGLRTLVGWLGGTSGRVWARITKVALAGTVVAVVVLLMPAASGPDWPLQVAPLPVGISPGVEQLMAQLREATEPTARILWEDDATTEPWSPLLPAWTDRHFIGGLSRQGPIEHLQWHLGEGQWRGRRLADWSDSELDRCVTSLNIGWIVAHSQGVLARCAAWPTADRPVPLAGGRHLIPLRRPHSYILHGQARVDTLDQRRITLVDVEPEDGVVLLSLHYHLTLRSTTNRVTLSPAAHLDGSVPLTRLHVPGPLSRLTINWD